MPAVWYIVLTVLLFMTGFSVVSARCPVQVQIVSGCNLTSLSAQHDSVRVVQRERGGFKHFVSKAISFLTDFDTTYVQPNYYSLTTMLQTTATLQNYRLAARDADGNRQAIRLKAPATFRAGPYFGWGPIFGGYTFDIAKVGTGEKKTEFNISFYTPIAGIDLIYVKNLGNFRITHLVGFPESVAEMYHNHEFGGMKAITKGLDLYYIFNHKRFSYPAAFSQSTIQKRSCGSWKVGFQCSQQTIDFNPALLPDDIKNNLFDDLKFGRLSYIDYSINVGYAYNWAFAPGWLLSLSVSPAVGLKKAKGERFWAERHPIRNYVRNFSFDLGTRSGLVWNNSRFYAGASAVSHMYGFRKDGLNLTNSYYYFYVYFGFNFLKKKKYR